MTRQHHDQIGTAVWEFLWFIDRITDEYEEDGERWGRVLRGKSIKGEEIADSLGLHPVTVKKNIRKLEQYGYIRTRRLQQGQAIDVRKSIKWLMRLHGASTTSPSIQPETAAMVTKLRTIPGVVAQDRDFGVMGKLISLYGIEEVQAATTKLREAMERVDVPEKDKVKEPLSYMAGILKKSAEKPKQEAKQEGPCPKCGGKGWYVDLVPYNNGLNMREENVTCECKKKKAPAWYSKIGAL